MASKKSSVEQTVTININGVDYTMSSQVISVDQIDPDGNNPRFGSMLDKLKRELTRSEVIDQYAGTPKFEKIKADICRKGVIQPIYIRRTGNRFKVIEGNTRWVGEFLLVQEKVERPVNGIPCYIVPDDFPIADFMASVHGETGVTHWDRYSQIRLAVINQKRDKMSDDQAAKRFGFKNKTEFLMWKDVYHYSGDCAKYTDTEADESRWSHWTEILKHGSQVIKTALKDDTVRDVIYRGVADGKCRRPHLARFLSKIVNNKVALKVFDKGDKANALEDALEIVDEMRDNKKGQELMDMAKKLVVSKDIFMSRIKAKHDADSTIIDDFLKLAESVRKWREKK